MKTVDISLITRGKFWFLVDKTNTINVSKTAIYTFLDDASKAAFHFISSELRPIFSLKWSLQHNYKRGEFSGDI